MRIVFINMEKDVEKRAFMLHQFNALGLSVERVVAICGKNIPSDRFRNMYSPFRWWCAVGRKIVPAEVGCAYSHYGIYSSIKPESAVCILEDDVVLEQDFLARLKEVERFINPKCAQVVLLSSHECPRYGKGIVPSVYGMCTDGYVITYPAAQVLLKSNRPMIVPCDHWWRWRKQGTIELYHALPSVVVQNQKRFGSSTQYNVLDVADYPPIRLFVHKLKRFIGVVFDLLFQACTGR